jgi:hypothetical protein
VRFTRIDTSSRRAAAQASGAIINPPNVGLSDVGQGFRYEHGAQRGRMGAARRERVRRRCGSSRGAATRSHEDAAVRRANEAAGE